MWATCCWLGHCSRLAATAKPKQISSKRGASRVTSSRPEKCGRRLGAMRLLQLVHLPGSLRSHGVGLVYPAERFKLRWHDSTIAQRYYHTQCARFLNFRDFASTRLPSIQLMIDFHFLIRSRVPKLLLSRDVQPRRPVCRRSASTPFLQTNVTQSLRRNMKLLRMLGMALLVLVAVGAASAQSQWTPVQNVPNIGAGAVALLTDGRVLVHDESGNSGTWQNWWTLTPDSRDTTKPEPGPRSLPRPLATVRSTSPPRFCPMAVTSSKAENTTTEAMPGPLREPSMIRLPTPGPRSLPPAAGPPSAMPDRCSGQRNLDADRCCDTPMQRPC